MTWFWVVGTAGVTFLLFATTYLVATNWGEQLYAPFFSVLLGGSITLLVAVLATLKGAREEAQFATVVVFDGASHRPLLVRPTQALTPAIDRSNSLAMAAAEVADTPTTSDEMFVYGAELLQYKLLTDLRDLQREGVGLRQTLGSATLDIRSAPPAVRLPDEVEIPPHLFGGYDSNRFSRTKSACFGWEAFGGLRAPRHATVQLEIIASPPKGGPRKHVVTLSRKGYFTLTITIEPVFGGAPGALPPGFEGAEGNVAQAAAHIYSVSMIAVFERLTGGNWRTTHYKRWTAWLMSEISRRNRVD